MFKFSENDEGVKYSCISDIELQVYHKDTSYFPFQRHQFHKVWQKIISGCQVSEGIRVCLTSTKIWRRLTKWKHYPWLFRINQHNKRNSRTLNTVFKPKKRHHFEVSNQKSYWSDYDVLHTAKACQKIKSQSFTLVKADSVRLSFLDKENPKTSAASEGDNDKKEPFEWTTSRVFKTM